MLLLSLVLVGMLLAGCGGDDEPADSVRSTTVQQILADPESWDEGPLVTVRGRAYPREGGFVLVESGSAVWVAAPAGAEAVDGGDRVTIRGDVERLAEADADEVVEAIRVPVDAAPPPPEPDAVEQTPAEIGDPFIVFRAVVSRGEQRATETGTGTTAADARPYDMADVHSRLEGAGLMLVRTGGGAGLAGETDEPTLAAPRYEISPSSREFELLIFSSRAAARRGLEDLRTPDLLLDEDYAFASAANVVAAFPQPADDFRGYDVVRRVLADLE